MSKEMDVTVREIFDGNFKKTLDKCPHWAYNLVHPITKGGAAMHNRRLTGRFFYFAKGCPNFVSFER